LVVTSKTRNRLIAALVIAIPVAIFVAWVVYKGLWGKPDSD
jgi:hypothetical protein